MDGGLDDPLVRMHRWDALRQRLANSAAGRLEPVVDEVIEAIASVLHRHGPVTVTVTFDGAETRTSAQLSWHEGQLVVARSEPQPQPQPLPADSGPGPVSPPRPAPTPAPAPAPAPATVGQPMVGQPTVRQPAVGQPMVGQPMVGPVETSDETAARLAELIRRDPSLLDGREHWGGPGAGG